MELPSVDPCLAEVFREMVLEGQGSASVPDELWDSLGGAAVRAGQLPSVQDSLERAVLLCWVLRAADHWEALLGALAEEKDLQGVQACMRVAEASGLLARARAPPSVVVSLLGLAERAAERGELQGVSECCLRRLVRGGEEAWGQEAREALRAVRPLEGGGEQDEEEDPARIGAWQEMWRLLALEEEEEEGEEEQQQAR